MRWGNFFMDKITKNDDGDVVEIEVSISHVLSAPSSIFPFCIHCFIITLTYYSFRFDM